MRMFWVFWAFLNCWREVILNLLFVLTSSPTSSSFSQLHLFFLSPLLVASPLLLAGSPATGLSQCPDPVWQNKSWFWHLNSSLTALVLMALVFRGRPSSITAWPSLPPFSQMACEYLSVEVMERWIISKFCGMRWESMKQQCTWIENSKSLPLHCFTHLQLGFFFVTAASTPTASARSCGSCVCRAPCTSPSSGRTCSRCTRSPRTYWAAGKGETQEPADLIVRVS